MKVMWMGNIILPAIAEKESLPPVYIVGWLVGLSRRLTQLPDVALTYVFDAPTATAITGLSTPHALRSAAGKPIPGSWRKFCAKSSRMSFTSGARKISTRWPWLTRRNTWGCASGL